MQDPNMHLLLQPRRGARFSSDKHTPRF